MQKKELGKKGEEIAIRFLKKKGYRILERNYVCKMGEMDIIAREKDTLAFIEVKTRTSTAFGPPQLAVNSRKQMQLSKVALILLKGEETRRCEGKVRCRRHSPQTQRRRD